MSEDAKSATRQIWETLRPDIEALTAKITAFYGALGSQRQCRHINELWHPENAGVGLGFVPPEAKERLETLIGDAFLHLHKSNGPLGKGVYFSLLYDAQLTPERMAALGAALERETQLLKDAPPAVPAPTLSPLEIMEEQVARMDGLTKMRGDRLRMRPAEVGPLVDSFNGTVANMSAPDVVKMLSVAIPYFDLPDSIRRELLRTVEMMLDAEFKLKT